MKYSKQRELIFNAVVKHPVHPDADTVYRMLLPGCPNLSLGTVYRNLNLLARQGLIKKLAIPYGSDRFDGRTDEHCHMVCERCGSVFDAEVGDTSYMDELIFLKSGFRVVSRELVFRGVCRECAGRETT